MSARDAAEYDEASYVTDPALHCDQLVDHLLEILHQECPELAQSNAGRKLVALTNKVVLRLLNEGRLGEVIEARPIQGRELLASLIGEIIAAPDARLMARCIDFVMMLGVQNGISETKIAEQSGVTKASASRYCVHLKEVYRGGKPAAGMKPNKAVESYRSGRTGRSSRSPRMDWAFAKTFAKHFVTPLVHGTPLPV